MVLQFQPPTDILDAYNKRRDAQGQELAQGTTDLLKTYAALEIQKHKESADSLGNYLKLLEIDPTFADTDFGKKLATQSGIAGTPQPAAAPTPAGQSLIDRFNQAFKLGTAAPAAPPGPQAAPAGPMPAPAAGGPPPIFPDLSQMSDAELSKHGKRGKAELDKRKEALAMQETRGKMAKKKTITREASLASGEFDPMTQMVMEPASNAAANRRSYAGNDPTGNPVTVDNEGNFWLRDKPYTGKIFPKSSNEPTASTRSTAEFATKVLPHISEMRQLINEADKKGYIGPVAGRIFGEVMAGRVGSTGNKDADRLLGKLRSIDTLMKSGTMRVHFGARGGQQMYDHFSQVLNSGKQSAAVLNGALDGIESYMQGYAGMEQGGGGVGTAPFSDAQKEAEYQAYKAAHQRKP